MTIKLSKQPLPTASRGTVPSPGKIGATTTGKEPVSRNLAERLGVVSSFHKRRHAHGLDQVGAARIDDSRADERGRGMTPGSGPVSPTTNRDVRLGRTRR